MGAVQSATTIECAELAMSEGSCKFRDGCSWCTFAGQSSCVTDEVVIANSGLGYEMDCVSDSGGAAPATWEGGDADTSADDGDGTIDFGDHSSAIRRAIGLAAVFGFDVIYWFLSFVSK